MKSTSTEETQAKLPRSKRNLVLSFIVPFLAVTCIWTLIDYCDISDGLEHERDVGVQHSTTEQEILINSLKKSLFLAIPASLIGLAVSYFFFKKTGK